MKHAYSLVLSAGALFLLLSCSPDKKTPPASTEPSGNQPVAAEQAVAPPFSVQDLSGRSVSLADLHGKVVLLNFWATWCQPCREEIPSMMKLEKAMAGRPFQMLAVSIDEGGKEAIEAFFRKSGLQLPTYNDPSGAIGRSYGITGVPESFIIDRSGVVVKKVVGSVNWMDPAAIAFLNDLTK